MKKAPYFPNVSYTETHTDFGAIETSHPTLYDNGIKQCAVVKVDCLYPLSDIIGENMFMNRDLVYKLVSGSVASNEEYVTLLEEAYKAFSKFRLYVDGQFLFQRPNENFITSIIRPLKEIVEAYKEEVLNKLTRDGAKLLMVTHHYIIVGFKHENFTQYPMMKVIPKL